MADTITLSSTIKLLGCRGKRRAEIKLIASLCRPERLILFLKRVDILYLKLQCTSALELVGVLKRTTTCATSYNRFLEGFFPDSNPASIFHISLSSSMKGNVTLRHKSQQRGKMVLIYEEKKLFLFSLIRAVLYNTPCTRRKPERQTKNKGKFQTSSQSLISQKRRPFFLKVEVKRRWNVSSVRGLKEMCLVLTGFAQPDKRLRGELSFTV